jgi:hypothetical protein
MPAYTGPIPPTPTGASTDAQWQSWWAYQNLLRDLRYEDERIARAAVLDQQHAEKMAAEAACAAVQRELAQAQEALAAAMREPQRSAPRTRAEMVFEMVKAHPHVTSMTELTIVQTCEKMVDAFLARHPQG